MENLLKNLITDKKLAGKFVRQTVHANIDTFKEFESPKDAYSYFKEHFPNVNIDYNNFFYHFNTAKKEMNIDKVVKTISTDEIVIPNTNSFKITPVVSKKLVIKYYNPKEEVAKVEIFNPYKSNKFIDNVMSKKGGTMPGTTTVISGGPSVGKTTIFLDLLHNITQTYINSLPEEEKESALKEFVYFSSEMKRIDIQAEEEEKPWMKEILSILLNEYEKSEYKELIEAVITYGYRTIVIDSFQNIVERLVSFCGMTSTQATTFLLHLIERANTGDTITGHCTSVLLIQQVTKGGIFVGKNSLKHDTTAFVHCEFDEKDKSKRFLYFSKNRRNGRILFQKLYYSVNNNNEITYDEKRWIEDRERENIMKTEDEQLQINKDNFNSLFINTPEADNAIWDDDTLEVDEEVDEEE